MESGRGCTALSCNARRGTSIVLSYVRGERSGFARRELAIQGFDFFGGRVPLFERGVQLLLRPFERAPECLRIGETVVSRVEGGILERRGSPRYLLLERGDACFDLLHATLRATQLAVQIARAALLCLRLVTAALLQLLALVDPAKC